MSRRKQAKPQHVEFDENKNNSSAGESFLTGECEQDNCESGVRQDRASPPGFYEALETAPCERVPETGACEEAHIRSQVLPQRPGERDDEELRAALEVSVSRSQEQAGSESAYSAAREYACDGHLPPTSRSCPFSSIAACTREQQPGQSIRQPVNETIKATEGQILESNSFATEEAYSLQRIAANCEQSHKETGDCKGAYDAAKTDMAEVYGQYTDRESVDAVMTSPYGEYTEDNASHSYDERVREYERDVASEASLESDERNACEARDASGALSESLDLSRSETTHDRVEEEDAEAKLKINEDDCGESNANSERVDRPNTPFDDDEVENRGSPGFATNTRDGASEGGHQEVENQTEDLRKEILATEAMAQAIQSMTAFAMQAGGGDEKPDISAIKNQVRMIKQQQAYQVQMLNFLQWQLTLASSDPQVAMAAAAAASARNGAMANGFGLNPQFPAQPFLGPGALPGLMPQMMTAMAMNNFKQPDNNGMTDFARARLMMSLQQHAAAGGAPNYRSLLARSMQDFESSKSEEHEQRYQLKDPAENDDREVQGNEVSQDSPTSPASGVHSGQVSKSDSGYDEDGKAALARGGSNAADDTSSSHGSQEDGELRDGVLKATAEEHRHRCRYCHKVFGSDSALQIHIRSHTGERPYKCNICGNRFTTKGNLKVHFMRHKSKYPHIPMNSQPVPEYLDHVPTSNGVPYGMSILPEKAVLERPRLHGNPSIHINPQQAAAMAEREAASQGLSNLFMPHMNLGQSNGAHDFAKRPDAALLQGMGADMASAIQAQLLQRRRAEYLESQWENNKNKSPPPSEKLEESKAPMTALQAAMLPFLPRLAANPQLEALPPHLRYLLPHHFHALQNQGGDNGGGRDANDLKFMPTPLNSTYTSASEQNNMVMGKSNNNRSLNATTAASETSKLQRLVENIDSGRVLQKNECHICHRILSCQSALKLHYRTHTGERPYKCDLCSRAFTTRGNLRTHYSSVHRQHMRPIPPGSQASRRTPVGPFPCSFCPARFREPIEYQQHIQMHAMVQEQQRLAEERGKSMLAEDTAKHRGEGEKMKTENAEDSGVESRESSKDMTEEPADDVEVKTEVDAEMRDGNEAADGNGSSNPNSPGRDSDNGERASKSPEIKANNQEEVMDLSSPNDNDAGSRDSNDSTGNLPPPTTNPLDSLAALSNLSASAILPQQSGSMLDHQLAALRGMNGGSLTVCDICEKPFSCQSALEIHLRTHTKERPFMCTICKRAFTTKGNLKQHLLTHNITDVPDQLMNPVASPREANASSGASSSPPAGETPPSFVLKRPSEDPDSSGLPAKRSYPRHWCHICQKQFSSASSLQIHNRTHTGEKPFACSVCGRAFTTKGNLKVHMGTHVWGAGGSRRGRRISMDNPLISPWMKNMRPRAPQNPVAALPKTGHVTDPAALYQQYAAIANGLLTAKQDAASNLMLPLPNGHPMTSLSPASSNGSLPPSEVPGGQNRVSAAPVPNPMSAATEWFLKAYRQTQEQVN